MVIKRVVPPQVFDRSNRMVAVLENAYDISYNKIKNGLWTASFTVSMYDTKNEYIKPKFFIDIYDHEKRIGRFVINTQLTIKDEATGEITYHCDHVMSLLHNDIIWGQMDVVNESTESVLIKLLRKQETWNWQLGEVSFSQPFHYSWFNEDSLLEAITDVPKVLTVPYMWTWNDESYPFTLNLVKPSTEITGTVIVGKNLKGIEIEEDYSELVTRLYPIGEGEGIDQTTIESVNGGSPYLQDNAARNEYGTISKIWTNTDYNNPTDLKRVAQAYLDIYKNPLSSVTLDAIDYELIDRKELEYYEIGYNVIAYDQDTGIEGVLQVEEINKSDVYGSPEDLAIVFGNLRNGITNDVIDVERGLEEVQDDAVFKERVYNGTSISPSDGFVATRSDKTARTIMNATDGFSIQKNVNGGWVNVVYLDVDGNAVFEGKVQAAEIIGSTIKGGSITGTAIKSDSTIDVYTDLRVGNMIYVGAGGNTEKGVIFSDRSSIIYREQALQLQSDMVTIVGSGSGGKANIFAGADIHIEAGMSTTISGNVNVPGGVNGILFSISGNELRIYEGGTRVGTVKIDLDDDGVG